MQVFSFRMISDTLDSTVTNSQDEYKPLTQAAVSL